MGAGWTNYADRLQGVWGAAILSARTANRLFSSKLCSFHLATTYVHCLSPNSSYLLLRNWNQNTWVINPRQSCFLQHPPVKQQHWKYPRSWEHGAHTDQSLAILPKRTGVSILIIKNVTVGQVTYSGHWAELEAQFLLQKSKLLLCFHNYIFSILSALVSRISCFNSFHKSLLISAGSPDITEGRGIPGLAQITAPGSAGASQQQELHTQSHRRFVWMQQVTLKCGAHNLIILLK